ncbi:MAG: 30S ribosomal protein S6 [Mariprofundaceae bacterium]
MYYETIFIVNPDVSQENTESITDNFIERIEKAGGRIVKREYWGARPLAYSIAKRKRGHYVMLVTDGESKAVEALEQAIRLDERILRFLTTRLVELSDEPSPLLRRKPASASKEEKSEEAPAAKDSAKEETTEEASAAKEVVAEEAPTAKEEVAEKAPATKKATAEETPAADTSGEETSA